MESKSWRPAVVVVGAVLVLAGCDSTGGGSTAVSTKPIVAADVPAGFDPCKDIPQSVLDSEKLRQKINDDANASGGIKWRGCLWVQTDGYAASIRTTNISYEMVEAKKFPDTKEFTIGGRRAISSRQLTESLQTACTVNVELKGGSVEFGLSNEPDNRNTGHLDSCALTRTLAEKVVPTIPATA